METRRLGRTEHHSSVAVLGAAAFWASTPSVVSECLDAALAAGVNHLDIAPQYGQAERLVGPFLPAVRDKLFVGCKTMRKNGDGVRAQLEESLSILGCEQFDLYQLHAVTSVAGLDERADAAAAVLRARDEGLTRFVGITGHDVGTLAAQAEALRRYDFDTVMFPVAPRLWALDSYRRDAEALLSLAAARDVGVMAIKAASARPKPADSDATTWYEPYRTEAEIARGVRFALSVEGVHGFCTPGDVRLLPLALSAAEQFTPMGPDERAEATDAVRSEALIFPMPA
ncbi:MAG TPA: aldo/keto reductase [Acidimicrobiales bacterium]|jgi:aryl-alcohol dehydrogenase-like predicted oxidoreductase|nr:aldo/keto reductase [Acidimicrobiales bacterium]